MLSPPLQYAVSAPAVCFFRPCSMPSPPLQYAFSAPTVCLSCLAVCLSCPRSMPSPTCGMSETCDIVSGTPPARRAKVQRRGPSPMSERPTYRSLGEPLVHLWIFFHHVKKNASFCLGLTPYSPVSSLHPLLLFFYCSPKKYFAFIGNISPVYALAMVERR